MKIEDFRYPGRISLPDLPLGLTTIYDAAMVLTDRNPRGFDDDPSLSIGFGTDYAPNWEQLKDLICQDSETWNVFVWLFDKLQAGRLQRVKECLIPGTSIRDPFLCLVKTDDATFLDDARKSFPWPRREADATCVSIDGALRALAERAGMPFGSAATCLQQALRAGELLAHESRNSVRREWPAETFCPGSVRATDTEPGPCEVAVILEGRQWHPGYFLMERASFEFWLQRQPTRAAPRNTGQVNQPSPDSTRPKPTTPAVIAWQSQRVKNWPDDKPAPSEANDWAAVSAHFADGMPRDQYRQIRERTTPLEWRKQGRRQPWGIVKARLS